MSQKIRLGILSTANIARNRFIPAVKNARNIEVTAVASRNLDKAREFARETGIPTAYGSYEELLAAPDIDAIYNPLPNSLHMEWSVKAAEAGKATLCEKPLEKDAPTAQKIVDAFNSRGILLVETFMYRFHPQIQRVKAMIDAGEIGTIQAMNSTFSFPIGNENDIRLNKELAGGSLRDVGCYCINIMRLMTGEEPKEISGSARFGEKSQVDEVLAGILKFPSGSIGHFDCSFRAQFTNLFDVRGSKGRILLEEAFVNAPDRPTYIRFWQEGDYQVIEIPAANQYTLMAEDFADALLNNTLPRYSAQDGVQNMQVIDRLLAQVSP